MDPSQPSVQTKPGQQIQLQITASYGLMAIPMADTNVNNWVSWLATPNE